MTTMAMATGRAGRAAGRRREAWDVARGVGGWLVGAALWAWVLAGVAAPLGGALARIEAARPPASVAPRDALASAPRAPPAERCR